MHLATLAERLADATGRLSELSIGDVEVRSSLALSYRALEPATACMFRRLGLVPGPDFTREVAAVVMETTSREAERSLDALVDAHLVENGSAEGRYRLAALLNLYARELARTEETEDDRRATLRRMLEWHLGRADAAEGLLIPGRRRLPYRRSGQWHEPAFASRADAAAWFEAERPGLVAATHQAAESELHAIAWQLPDALRSYLCLRSSWTDLRHTHHVGLFAARKAGNRQAEAWMMTSLGQTYCELHQFDQAIDLCLGSLALYRAIGDREGEARALCGLGNSYMEVRRLAEAVQCHQQALAISQQSRYLYREASVWRHLGVAYGALRRFDEAIGCLRRALSIHRELGDRWHEGDALLHLAQVYGDRQRFKESVRYVQRALAIHREVGYRWGEARALELLGLALQHSQGKEAAHVRWREALAIFLQLGAPQVDEVRALMGVPESPPGRSLRLCPQPVRSHS
jgi:tetratricopeptide (TPR) repeat protein